MKKIIAFCMICVLMLLFAGSAMAFNWSYTPVKECDEYNIVLTKYEKVSSTVGTAFNANANTTAVVGDKVYFSVEAFDKNGRAYDDYDIKYHDVSFSKQLSNGLVECVVVGDDPYVQVEIVVSTPVTSLSYKGNPIGVTNTTVIIDGLQFMRDANGIVTDVNYNGNVYELQQKLVGLGITVEDIYNGKVCMSDKVLVQNFGVICENVARISWAKPTVSNNKSPIVIPKTGDMGFFAWLFN